MATCRSISYHPGMDVYDELKLKQESLEFALQSAGMGTWDIDLSNDSLQCSQAMLKLWEVTPEEFNGDRSILQRKVHPDDVQAMRDAINLAIETESIYDHEYRILPREGVVRWVRSRGRCTYSAESKKPVRLSGVVFDVTASREKDEALELALQTREKFLVTAGHELKTPLTGLQLQLQALESELMESFPETLESPLIASSLSRQNEQIWRLARIIDNLCEGSQMAGEKYELKLEKLDLKSVISDLLGRFRSFLCNNHGLDIIFHCPADCIQGLWDKFRIEHVMVNLVANAFRYGDRKQIVVELHRSGDDALISVKDFGKGFRPDVPSDGMGLGLYICDRIVRSHGGSILVKSEEGKGSIFTIKLPVRV